MGSGALRLLKGASSLPLLNPQIFISTSLNTLPVSNIRIQKCSTAPGIRASLQPPDVPRLAETARISLNPSEVEEFAPKIRQVVDWFGQLEAVDLQSIEPSIRADTEGGNQRDDVSETFENREALIGAVPVFDEPYIRVPKVLNKE
ncbi:glutamyl-tRNA(Gln) amidotransferase subunit C, chloroplastic/mitochondrial-like [Cucurbita maxima]|uniref:Glutamyl-tRNA(Gln) amidotransferase subunit C, chloroplastic/mitochondrial n=1 Tax=Cucurbita maxima TaxID=3661 RepID=A0A6J1IVG1_CUCMA|nr:glutamyl-tRNA(Gln) amidotransferase subunit C, chloroplastic/mitochondrial-like [Cucurbita maxima]XP_022981071.1 glutamyl-tRNA(Gln) amidotransferase subunit C, chloroplastic/mitochondrial-like [Cucurbita maxima]